MFFKSHTTMKKVNYLFLLMMCVMTITSLSSCLGDNDDDQRKNYSYLTHDQRMQMLNAATGNYTGWMYYVNTATQKRDSTALNWQISGKDSTLTIASLPLKQFANYTNNNTAKDVLNNTPEQNLTATIYAPYVIRTEEWNNQFYQYSLVPKDLKLSFTTADNKKCELSFIATQLSADYLYYPIMQYYKGQNLFYLLVKDLKIDDATYSINNAFVVRTKR
ncbi:hypothetical protein C3V39_03450 [Prevotella sp. oral taxon 820]|nr:hypothetical protein C3V39_03450 [Prevotella sp. oral taxon 820]